MAILYIATFSAPAISTLGSTAVRASLTIEEKTSSAVSAPFPVSAVSATPMSRASSTSTASASICFDATSIEVRYPSTSVSGCSPLASKLFASSNNAPQSIIAVVTPSPQASS